MKWMHRAGFCDICGTAYQPQRKFNSGNPKVVQLPGCDCLEKETNKEIESRINRMIKYWF